MRNIINNLNKTEKLLFSILIGWTLLHLVLLFVGITQNDYFWGPSNSPYFWPFDEPGVGNSYDFTEFTVYAIIPDIVFIVYLYLSKNDKNNG